MTSTKKIHNVATGEIQEVELTPEEVAESQRKEAEREAKRLAKEQAEAERQAKLESAKAKLSALGLDEAEVNAILGL